MKKKLFWNPLCSQQPFLTMLIHIMTQPPNSPLHIFWPEHSKECALKFLLLHLLFILLHLSHPFKALWFFSFYTNLPEINWHQWKAGNIILFKEERGIICATIHYWQPWFLVSVILCYWFYTLAQYTKFATQRINYYVLLSLPPIF